MIKLKKIKPMFGGVITTADKHDEDVVNSIGLIDTSKAGTLKEYQTVLAIGPDVRSGIEVGQLICVNPANYIIRKYAANSVKEGIEKHNEVVGYNFNFIEINDKLCLKLRDNDIDYIVEEYDEVADPEPIMLAKPTEKSSLILPPTNLILPR